MDDSKQQVKSGDWFGTFLETTKKLRENTTPWAKEVFPAPHGDAPTKILEILAGGPKRIHELMTASDLPLPELAETLKTLVEAGLVTASGFASNDEVALTPQTTRESSDTDTTAGAFDELNEDEKFVLTLELFGKKTPQESKEFCIALDELLKKYGAKTRVATRATKRSSDP